MVIKALIGLGEGGGLVLKRDGVRIIEDLVPTTFKITTPISNLLGEFAATGNDDSFHDTSVFRVYYIRRGGK